MFGVDAGGTFTDVVAFRDGKVEVTKVPSDPDSPAAPVVEGARRLGVEGAGVFNHASTLGLNSVITRRLPKVGFLTTEGHRDMLTIGQVWRPLAAQTDPGWRRPFGDTQRPLVPRYLRRPIRERILGDGEVIIPLDEEQARSQLEVLARCEVEGVAICLVNAYVNAAHEERLLELATDVLGDVPVSISSTTSPLAKEYARASTTVVDAMMKLLYSGYAELLEQGLADLAFAGNLNFADCAANLLPYEEALAQPFKIVFAGPAAGTVSCRRLGAALDEGNMICADVGGTSTDISLIVDGEPFVQNTFELEHDLVINALSTEISSVGAGGGSIISITSSGDVAVGPASAGAMPGPACYGRGGTEPTVTDACLLMGIIDPEGFAGGQLSLDRDAARAAFAALDSTLPVDRRIAYAYRLAVANIAEEVTNISIRHGIDQRDFSLMAYGAAGPMLLPAALEPLRMKRAIVPPHPGLFSAIGLICADQVYAESRSAYLKLGPDTAPRLDELFAEMEASVRAKLPDGGEHRIRRSFDGRLQGQSWETPFVEVPAGPITSANVGELTERFHREYEARFGNRFEALPIYGVTYRVELVIDSDKLDYAAELPPRERGEVVPSGTFELRHLTEEPVVASEYRRDQLLVGDRVEGPAVIREELCTTLVCPGQQATRGAHGELVIESATAAGEAA